MSCIEDGKHSRDGRRGPGIPPGPPASSVFSTPGQPPPPSCSPPPLTPAGWPQVRSLTPCKTPRILRNLHALGTEKGEAQVSTRQAHAPSQDPSSRGPVMRLRRFHTAASVRGVGGSHQMLAGAQGRPHVRLQCLPGHSGGELSPPGAASCQHCTDVNSRAFPRVLLLRAS